MRNCGGRLRRREKGTITGYAKTTPAGPGGVVAILLLCLFGWILSYPADVPSPEEPSCDKPSLLDELLPELSEESEEADESEEDVPEEAVDESEEVVSDESEELDVTSEEEAGGAACRTVPQRLHTMLPSAWDCPSCPSAATSLSI